MGLNAYEGGDRNYVTVQKGTLRTQANEGDEGAKKRTYEFKDDTGKTVSGEKWEHIFQSISGMVTSVAFYDGNYGTTLNINLDGENILQINKASRYFSSLLERLPAVDLEKEVTFRPYDFEDDNGKRNVGFSVQQDGDKLKSHFYDADKKKTINGMPSVSKKDASSYDSDDWKVFFISRDKFLQKYTQENVVPNVKSHDGPAKSTEAKSGDVNLADMEDDVFA